MTDRTDRRMSEVLRRAKKRRRAQETHLLAGLSCACVALLSSLVGAVGSVAGAMPQSDIVTGAYGAVLLHSGASVYVLVGLLAFIAGVMITALCMKMRQKNSRDAAEKNHEENTK
ncbi:MAG: hypothetical protein RSD27_08540 [Ruthenibacterium sp.]